MHSILFGVWTFLACSLLARAQRGDIENILPLFNPCASFDTCNTCLQQPNCAWCTRQDFSLTMGAEVTPARCNPRDWYEKNKEDLYCDRQDVVDFQSSLTILVNESLVAGDEIPRKGRRIIQLQPQKLFIRARLNESIGFSMQFTQASNYPVDLYYIMDLSKSMEDDRNNLAKLGNSLAEAMRQITSNFRIGFGSFIDKPVAPFSSEHPSSSLESPYLFRHHMNLSSDTEQFSRQVLETTTRGNEDSPEGGLEALMQVIVCQDQIGWRHDSRRLIVFSTDAAYHLAGDGKLAGITKPNDESCHMNQKGHYVRDQLQDYPSIAQIARKIVQYSINIIFAVPSSVEPIYRHLVRRLPGAVVGALSDDSSNIVELIKEEYQKINSVVQITHNASRLVGVKFLSSCLRGGGLKETSKCSGLQTGSMVRFNVNVTATWCPSKRDFTESIRIHPVGINESMIIELQVQCQCPCDKDSQPNDKRCNGVGEYKCGVCQCNPGYSGIKCSCNPENVGSESNSKRCRSPSSPLLECSGRGSCQCGTCHCMRPPNNEGTISGTYCECDDFNCPRNSNGMICSGRGRCQCHGVCQCSPGWTGRSCDCSTDDSECKLGSEICSGRGTCLCGQCVCNEVQGARYKGKFCEDCPTCRCSEYLDCVQLLAFKSGSATREQCDKRNLTVIEVGNIQVESNEQRCTYELEDGCAIIFVYAEDSKVDVIRVEKICPNTTAIAGGVTGSILLAGLLLLALWKAATTVHDRMEYSRFLRERALARWNRDENPMYRRPTSVFTNPTYNTE